MKFLQDLIPLRLYNAKKKIYIPLDDKDKTHGSAIFLMGTTQEQSESMMHLPYIYSKPIMFRGYYIDRDIMHYIDADSLAEEDVNEYDEVQEAVLSEGILHAPVNKNKIVYDSSVSTMDERVISTFYTNKYIESLLKSVGLRKNPYSEIKVYTYRDLKDFNKKFGISDKNEFYSISIGNTIHVLGYGAYNPNTMDGPYNLYLYNELITCILLGAFPDCHRSIIYATAMSMSGQLDYLRKEKKVAHFRYNDDKNQNNDKIKLLYFADVIFDIYALKGPRGIYRLLSGDMNDFISITGRRFIDKGLELKDKYYHHESYIVEGNLSAEDRKNLKSSDYGIPSKKKYPMSDEAHVRAAIRMFNHVSSEDEAELAKNIKSKMKKFNITDVDISDKNRLSHYIHESDEPKKSHKLTVKSKPRNNPNDTVSPKGVKLDFYDGNDHIGEASISSVDTDQGFLYDVEVFEKFRGQGYANDLMKYILSHYRVNELTVEKGNDIAINLYKKFGFKKAMDFKENGKDMIDMKIDLTKKVEESVMIAENFLISGNDIEINLDKWKNEKGHNILYVTGFSGSGKTTLGEKYEKENPNTYIFELDGVEMDYDSSNMGILDQVKKEFPEYVEFLSEKDSKKNGYTKEDIEILVKAMLKCIHIMQNMPKYRFVVEGIQIYDLFAERDINLEGKPIVIKGTSAISSMIRRIKRDVGGKPTVKEVFDLLKAYWKANTMFSKFKRRVNESAEELVTVNGIPGLEYDQDGELLVGNYSPEYLDILTILKDFSKEEFDRISFNSTYKDSPYIKMRIVLKDPNEYPMSFMDVYHFPNNPQVAYITTAVGLSYRGHHLCAHMWQQLLDSNFAEENGIFEYIWHAHPINEASKKIALAAGFELVSDKLDKYGRLTYRYNVRPIEKAEDVKFPDLSTESCIMVNESTMFLFNEAEAKYDSRFKRFLFKKRLKTAKDVMAIYDEVKSRNPNITRTYKNLELYKGLNIWVDTSYYHNLYIQSAPVGNKKSMEMYIDFLNRLMENEDIAKSYKRITYFFPVQTTRRATTADALFDWMTDINPISAIVYMVRKNPEALKKWANKSIVFVGEKGYFVFDASAFDLKKLPRFKKNITRLLAAGELIDDEIEDPDPEETEADPKAIASMVIDRISDKVSDMSKVKIPDTGLNHLGINHTTPSIVAKDTPNAILIVTSDSSSALNIINTDKALKNKGISVYYKPKL